jgi:hypothetical protein
MLEASQQYREGVRSVTQFMSAWTNTNAYASSGEAKPKLRAKQSPAMDFASPLGSEVKSITRKRLQSN